MRIGGVINPGAAQQLPVSKCHLAMRTHSLQVASVLAARPCELCHLELHAFPFAVSFAEALYNTIYYIKNPYVNRAVDTGHYKPPSAVFPQNA